MANERFARLLAGHQFFAAFEARDLNELASLAHTRKCKKGQTIFLKGDPGDSLMAVLSGCVKVSAVSDQANAREVVFNIIRTGEIFGEIGLLDGRERTANATALEDSELLVLRRNTFIPFVERHPKLAMALIDLLCGRLRRTSDFVEDLRFRDVEKRLARRLLWLARGGSDRASDRDGIAVRIRHQDLAEFAGVSRETTTKQISLWRKTGLIRTATGYIDILDLPRLENIAGDTPPEY